jgi:hypothetical protein
MNPGTKAMSVEGSSPSSRPSMNPRAKSKAVNDWKHLGLSSLTLTLTPALSPGERGNPFPRIGNMLALDLTRFRGSMREPLFGEFSSCSPPPRAQTPLACRDFLRLDMPK